MSAKTQKVALVAPVFNRRETTLRALRSISRIRKGNLEVKIFIVDDGSTDGTADAIRASFPDVEVIIGDGTLHYAGGTNRGIVRALEWQPDFIVTMNDDAVFHDRFLERLVSAALHHPRSIVGALLLLWDQPDKVFQVGLHWKTLKGGWQIPNDLSAFTMRREAFEVECIVGNCVLFPVAAIREVGLMDERRFPHGWGDAQWTAKMRKSGWRLLVEPRSLVWCEPNTYPQPLHSAGVRQALNVLFRDHRHPLNLRRQFEARWHSAPSRVAAATGFGVYLLSLLGKSLKYGLLRDRAA
jgi:GT2 family glycosyltransferase